jgi:integrase
MPQNSLTIDAINERLKAAKVGVRVYARGARQEKLSLRAVLPPKPGSKRQKPYQQYLSLDVYANPTGLKFAEAEAKRIGGLLAQKRFEWDMVTQEADRSKETCSYWVERFRQNWLKSQTGDKQEIELRWKEQFWYPAFKWLTPERKLTADLLEQTTRTWKPNSRSLQIGCQKLQRLADFAGIECDLKSKRGNYNPNKVVRNIPPDEQIISAIDAIKNRGWQWIAATMATYGLRDHEAFLCEIVYRDYGGKPWPVALVPDTTKTGSREVFPLPLSWVERWDLLNITKPNIAVRLNKDYGDRTSTQFSRYKIPFRPYDLRHAWNIRAALDLGLPTAVAAQMAGHSATLNLGTYQKHISKVRVAQAYFEALKNNNSEE